MTLLIGLAGYRLWRLIAMDVILEQPRDWLYDRAEGSRAGEWFVEMISCVWCLGWWLTGLLAATAALVQNWSTLEFVLVWPAASAVAGLVRVLDPSSRD